MEAVGEPLMVVFRLDPQSTVVEDEVLDRHTQRAAVACVRLDLGRRRAARGQ